MVSCKDDAKAQSTSPISVGGVLGVYELHSHGTSPNCGEPKTDQLSELEDRFLVVLTPQRPDLQLVHAVTCPDIAACQAVAAGGQLQGEKLWSFIRIEGNALVGGRVFNFLKGNNCDAEVSLHRLEQRGDGVRIETRTTRFTYRAEQGKCWSRTAEARRRNNRCSELAVWEAKRVGVP